MKVKKIISTEYKEKEKQVASRRSVSVQCEVKGRKILAEIKTLESELALTQRKIEQKIMQAQDLREALGVANSEWRSALEDLKNTTRMIDAE